MILDVIFEQITADIPISFVSEEPFCVTFGEIVEIPPANLPTYSGDYNVVPAFHRQTMETAGLMMEEDVNIEKIPLSRVSNNSGGMTVIIGG